MREYILAGDIGGTKTRLSLYEANTGPHSPQFDETFASKDFLSLADIVKKYLKNKKVHIQVASFGIAGPVKNGRVETTNLPWVISEDSLKLSVNNAPVFLLNDLQASAIALPHLNQADILTINPGKKQPQGTIGLVSPGTGLGEAFLICNDTGYQAHPSEGGHCSFAPTTINQAGLANFLLPQSGHISYERVCSGIGIVNLYRYIKESKQAHEPKWLKDELEAGSDPNPIIFKAALNKNVEIAEKTLRLFIEILANEAANLALKVMATGGIFLGGGIPPRLIPLIDPNFFMTAFTNKGRFAEWLSVIPIYLVRDPNSALFGAACYAFEKLEE
jgi:glucokinase